MANHEVYYQDRREAGPGYEMHVRLDFRNRRIKVDVYRGNVGAIIQRMNELAVEHACTKALIKSRQEDWQTVLSKGYTLEGIYRRFINGSDVYCMALYFDDERRTSARWIEEDQILQAVQHTVVKQADDPLPDIYRLRTATVGDAAELARMYAATFPVYPTPIKEPEYIQKQMNEGTIFSLIETLGQIVSVGAALITPANHHAEITDCVTLPEYRKFGLMKVVVQELEKELYQREIYCSFSHARAISYGMNAVFHHLGYTYTGRLTNNCEIYDTFEDMNLWVKDLADKLDK